jgi:hypothetical protein
VAIYEGVGEYLKRVYRNLINIEEEVALKRRRLRGWSLLTNCRAIERNILL